VRVYPPVGKEEMLAYLTAQAKVLWPETSPVSDAVLDTVAEAMAMISAIDVPDDIEPMFP
jgi:hypothetical protein